MMRCRAMRSNYVLVESSKIYCLVASSVGTSERKGKSAFKYVLEPLYSKGNSWWLNEVQIWISINNYPCALVIEAIVFIVSAVWFSRCLCSSSISWRVKHSSICLFFLRFSKIIGFAFCLYLPVSFVFFIKRECFCAYGALYSNRFWQKYVNLHLLKISIKELDSLELIFSLRLLYKNNITNIQNRYLQVHMVSHTIKYKKWFKFA